MSWKRAEKSSAVTSMENMGTYFEDEQKKSRWESGQAILHRESVDTKKQREGQKENEGYRVKNSYGQLRYLKKDKNRKEAREGFALEAFEAPGTQVHTEKEKHLNRETMKRVRKAGKQTLYASEVPLQNQAIFFDMAGSKRSKKFIRYMKELLHSQGHQTLRDTFGFLDQEPERMELEALNKEHKDSLSPEMNQTDKHLRSEDRESAAEKRMDSIRSRLLRKEARERQLCSELQLMLEDRAREEAREKRLERMQSEQDASHPARKKGKSDDFRKKQSNFDQNVSETPVEDEAEETPEAPETDN